MKRSYPIQVEIDIDCCESCIDKDTCDHIDKCTITKNIYQSCYKEESYVKVITLISNKGTNLLDITNDIFDKKCELEKNRYVVLLITDLSSPLSSVDKKKISISDEILIFNYTTNISEEAKECIDFAKDNNVVVKYKTCLHENLFTASTDWANSNNRKIKIIRYLCKDCPESITKSYDNETGELIKSTIDSKEIQSLESKPDKNIVDDFLGIIDYNIIDPSIKKIHINIPTYNNRLYLDFLSKKYNINSNIKEIAQNILLDDEDLHENKELIKDVKTMFFIDRDLIIDIKSEQKKIIISFIGEKLYNEIINLSSEKEIEEMKLKIPIIYQDYESHMRKIESIAKKYNIDITGNIDSFLDNDTEIMAIMEDKKGQLRNLISGRFNFSTRAVIVPNIKENHKGKLLSIEEVLKLKDDTKLYVENSYYDDHFGEDSNIHEMKLFIDENNQPIISVYMNRNKSYSHYIQEDFKNLRIYEWVEGDNIDGK